MEVQVSSHHRVNVYDYPCLSWSSQCDEKHMTGLCVMFLLDCEGEIRESTAVSPLFAGHPALLFKIVWTGLICSEPYLALKQHRKGPDFHEKILKNTGQYTKSIKHKQNTQYLYKRPYTLYVLYKIHYQVVQQKNEYIHFSNSIVSIVVYTITA